MTGTPALRPSEALVADLEQFLGDPEKDSGPFSFRQIVEHEKNDTPPPGAVERITEWGFPAFTVPEAFGGRLRNLEQISLLTRSLVRRNATVALRFGTSLLGANAVWLWGNEAQRAHLAQGLLDGELTGFAVSERDHGSDVLGNEATAVPDGDSLILSGEKWPVGNATRGRFATVAATIPGAGPSLLMIDKATLPKETLETLPFVGTAGLRGHDLSGTVFRDTPVPADAVLGVPGSGARTIVQTLQVTRVAIGALSLGTMDSVLRLTLRHAQQRRLYGAPIHQLPVIRRHLLRSHLDLLIAECTVLPVARSLTVCPSRLSLWSSAVKYLAPTLGEEVVAESGRVLGARSYIQEGVADGVFQKLQRDHAIASIFEGTTHVNLHSIAAQLPSVAAHAEKPPAGGEELLRELFDASTEAPVWQPSGRDLRVTNASQDEITRGWAPAVEAARAIAARDLPPVWAQALDTVLNELSARRAELYAQVHNGPYDANSTQGQDVAAVHCIFHAAASCLYTWLYNPEQGSTSETGSAWLILVLQRLLQRLDPTTTLEESCVPALERVMLDCLDGPEYFSVRAIRAAAAAERQT